MGSLWSVEALPLFSYGFVAIHRCSHFGLSSNSSSFPIDDVLPFLQIYYASQSINQTKSRKLIQFQEISKTHLKAGLKPVRKRLEIRSCPSSLQQLPSSASTWPSLLQLNDAFHPSHLQCCFPLLTTKAKTQQTIQTKHTENNPFPQLLLKNMRMRTIPLLFCKQKVLFSFPGFQT